MKDLEEEIAEIAKRRDALERFVRDLAISTHKVGDTGRRIYLVKQEDVPGVRNKLAKIERKIEQISDGPRLKRLWLPNIFTHVLSIGLRTYDAFTTRGEGRQRSGIAYKLRVVTKAGTFFTSPPQWSVVSQSDASRNEKIPKTIAIERSEPYFPV